MNLGLGLGLGLGLKPVVLHLLHRQVRGHTQNLANVKAMLPATMTVGPFQVLSSTSHPCATLSPSPGSLIRSASVSDSSAQRVLRSSPPLPCITKPGLTRERHLAWPTNLSYFDGYSIR